MAYPRAGGTDARIITISGTSAPVYNTANTTSTIETATSGYGSIINQIDSTNFIVFGYLGSVKYTVSGTTVTHVSDRVFTFYNSISVATQLTMLSALFNNGDYAVIGLYQTEGYHLLKKDGNHMGVKNRDILFNKLIGIGTPASAYASKIIELDTNTLAVVTNNGGVSPLLTSIVKYIGG